MVWYYSNKIFTNSLKYTVLWGQIEQIENNLMHDLQLSAIGLIASTEIGVHT
jgi:hypothetical protein